MKIAWVNDYILKEFLGGAQITNNIMINEGRKLGHEITEITPNTLKDYELDNFDLFILNNINHFQLEEIEGIIKNRKFMCYMHDYLWCKNRRGQCLPRCIPANIFQNMFSKSLLNIFLSPLQLGIYREAFKETMRDAIIIPSPLNKEFLYKKDNKKRKPYLCASVLQHHKGIDQIIDYAEENKIKIDFVGKPVSKRIVQRIKKNHNYIGVIPFKDMPKLYQGYEKLVINPLWPEPFGRFIIEAIASGCEIITFAKSNKPGYASFNLSSEEMIKKCLKAPEVFWNKIKELKLC